MTDTTHDYLCAYQRDDCDEECHKYNRSYHGYTSEHHSWYCYDHLPICLLPSCDNKVEDSETTICEYCLDKIRRIVQPLDPYKYEEIENMFKIKECDNSSSSSSD